MCRGIQGHPLVYFGGYMYILYQQYVYSDLFFKGLCTSNMFIVLQVVILSLYMSYKFCVVIYLITKIYLSTKMYFIGGRGWAWVNQHSMHLHSVTLSNMLRISSNEINKIILKLNVNIMQHTYVNYR